jgi:peroxiredoxin Q/BCP
MAKKADVIYPAEGKPAPAFTLPASNGKKIKLSDYKGKRAVVLFFYPRDMTSGCTKEACGFRDNYGALKKAKIEVFGVSPDSVARHEKFIEKEDLNYILLADEDHKVAEKYGVWQAKRMYGREHMGIARTTFVIDKQGRVAKVFPKVKPPGHADEVLEWIRQNLK